MARKQQPASTTAAPHPIAPSTNSYWTEKIFRRAVQAQAKGNLAAAEASFREILAADPRHAGAAHALGELLFRRGHLDQALEMMAHAIVLDGTRPDFYANFGYLLQAKGMAAEATSAYQRALALDPNHVDATFKLAVILHAQNKLPEALVHYRTTIRLRPTHAEAQMNLGNILVFLSETHSEAHSETHSEAAIEHYRHALAANPRYAEAYINWANVLLHRNKLAEAIVLYERGVALWPANPAPGAGPACILAHHNLAMAYLLQGNFARGLAHHEWRHLDPAIAGGWRTLPHPLWQGAPLHGARIVLHSEQGFGDTLQFLRYVPLVQQAGGTVLLIVQPCLRRLAETLPHVTVFCHGDPIPPFDIHCPLMSLPKAFATELATIPAQVPYLSIPQAEQDTAAVFPWPSSGLRVGLVWAGNPGHLRDRHRSVPFNQIETLLDIEGVHFFSLQLGPAAGQASGAPLIDLPLLAENMAATAAHIAPLDLVITVDTAMAHLAGALGIRTWLLLAFAPDWRWLLHRDDSPWYPTLRLFRQTAPGDWPSALTPLRQALQELRELSPQTS